MSFHVSDSYRRRLLRPLDLSGSGKAVDVLLSGSDDFLNVKGLVSVFPRVGVGFWC